MMNHLKYQTAMQEIRQKLLRKARQNFVSVEDAEDVVQEVLIRMWLARDKWESYQNWEAVAMQTLRNCTIDNFRKHKITQVELDEVEHHETPLQTLENKDITTVLSHSINQLPNLQRLIIRLKDVEGYEIEEIASITQTSPDSVRMNLSRARKKVRESYLTIK